jgi:ubiquinone/menaquinone biosynthesis C-methylase UbiE
MQASCPICENYDKRIVGKSKVNNLAIKFIEKDYNIVQCNNCKLYYVSPTIEFSDKQWSQLYHSEYFSSQTEWLLKKRTEELAKRFEQAESLLVKNSKINFLDVGAGEGKALLEAAKRNWISTGIDIVDNRIEEAKSDKINFIETKFLEYSFPDNHFDFIYMDSVLEHVLNPKEYLKKIKRILKPGGIVYIGVPNENSLFNDVRKMIFYFIGRKHISVRIKPFDTPYHVVGFNKKSLKYLINDLNFKILIFRNIGRRFEFLSSKPYQPIFWVMLLLTPIDFLAVILKKDYYYQTFITK